MFELTSQQAPDHVVVSVAGELDSFAAQKLDGFLAETVDKTPMRVVIDLSGLSYMNSSGLRSFLRLDKLLKARGLDFVIRGTQRHVARSFIYGSLDSYFRFEDPDLSEYANVARC